MKTSKTKIEFPIYRYTNDSTENYDYEYWIKIISENTLCKISRTYYRSSDSITYEYEIQNNRKLNPINFLDDKCFDSMGLGERSCKQSAYENIIQEFRNQLNENQEII